MRKKTSILFLILTIVLFTLGLFIFKVSSSHSSKTTEKIWVISDTHFLAPTLYDDGEAFEAISKTTVGKDLFYQHESWEALIKQAKKEKPDILIVAGDLTFNGEFDSAKQLATYFKKLEKNGTHVYPIPGNHDIFDGWAREYKEKDQLITKQISPTDFKTIFSTSYQQATSLDEYSLSYRIPLTTNMDALLLDSNIYTIEPIRYAPITAGRLKKETLKWLEQQLDELQKQKKTAIIFMHHNLLIHNQRVHQGYVLNNHDELKTLLSKYQVPLVLSGHIHAQNALKDEDTNIIEISTGSFATSEQNISELILHPNQITYEKKTLDSSDIFVKNQPYADYLKTLLINSSKGRAYQQLVGAEIDDVETLDAAANLIGETNWRFFTGNDQLTDQEIKEIRQSQAFHYIEQRAPSMAKYLISILKDDNLPDDQLLIDIQKNR